MENNKAEMINNTENSPAKYHIWGLLAALGLGATILLPTLWYDLGADQALYNYIAWAWLKHGIPPCRSNNTGDMPGIIFLSMLALKMFGVNVIALRLFDFFIQLFNLSMIFYLAVSISKIPRKHLAGIIATGLYAIFYLGLGHWHTAQKDGFALPFLLAAAFIYLKLLKDKSLPGIFLIGLMVGTAFLMKPSFALAGLAFAILLFHRGWKLKNSSSQIIFEQLILFISALIPLIIIAIIYKITGVGLAFWEDWWIYRTRVFVPRNVAGIKGSYLHYIAFAFPYLMYVILKKDHMIWLGAFLYFIQLAMAGNFQDKKSENRLVLSALLIVCALSFLVQGVGAIYHKIPLAGFAVIFAGEFFNSAIYGIAADQNRRRGLISYTGVIFILGLELLSLAPKDLKFIAQHSFRNLHQAYLAQEPWYHKTAEYIDSHTTANQYVGSGGYIEFRFLAKRLAPTRQISVIAITLKDQNGNIHPLEIKWQNELCADLNKNPPPYLVWVDVAMPEVNCLKEYVDKNYVLETQITDIHGLFDQEETAYIYRRK